MTCHDSRSDSIDAEFNGSWSVLRSVWISHPKQLEYINVQNNKNPGFYHHFVSSFFKKHLSLGIQPPNLRMVSWNLNTMRFGGDEGHPKHHHLTFGDWIPTSTPPKFNMEPENQPLEKEIPIGNHHFQVSS